MISVDNHFYFSIGVRSIRDFLRPEDLIRFALVELAGNILPYFEIEFVTSKASMIADIHEGVDLNIQFGKTRDEIEDIIMTCSKLSAERQGQGKFRITVKGYASKSKYLQNTRTKSYGKVSGVEAVRACVSQYFKPVFNIAKSDDSMIWIQAGESDRNFVFDTLLRSYRRNSFLACAITGDGEFIVKDIKEELKKKSNKVDWVISNSSGDTEAFKYRSNYQILSQTGLVNAISGYGKQIVSYGQEEGTTQILHSKPEVLMALSKDIAKRQEVEAKFAGSEVQNQNVHANFWKAYQANIVGAMSISAVKIGLELDADYQKIRPLDVVMFKDMDIENSKISSEYLSGIYIVSKVERVIQNNRCKIRIEICRESFNQIRS